MKTTVKIQKIDPKAQCPKYMSEGAAGCDVTACLEKAIEIKPRERVAVPTGLIFEIPEGFEVQVRPRSGLAYKKGLTVVNAPGTVDSDYRGEVKVLLINLSDHEVVVEPGERVAQLVLSKVERIEWEEKESLNDTDRGAGGFGSTGR